MILISKAKLKKYELKINYNYNNKMMYKFLSKINKNSHIKY